MTADHDPEAAGERVADAAGLQAFVDSLYGSGKPERVVEALLDERPARSRARMIVLGASALLALLFPLGDRACLALAMSHGLPALTADRRWAELDLPVPVQPIR